MNKAIRTLRRVVGIGLAWTIVWGALWALVVAIFGVVDPDSIDPGEGPMVVAAVLGPMGLLSGVAFAILLSIVADGRRNVDLSLTHVAALGILGSAIGQLAYLGHGDMGLAANIKMALLFSVFGGGVTVVWLVISRSWSRRRSEYLSRDPHDFRIG